VPYPSLFYGISRAEISSRVAFEKYGADYANHPIGPGPYTVKEQISGNAIVYDRNPDYTWPPPFYTNRGPAYLDGITIKIIKEDVTTWNALKAGEAHIAPIPTTYIKEAETNPDLTIIKRLEPTLRYIAMNCAKPPFNDPLVRQAVTHAIDREAIVTNAMDGYGQALYTPFPVAMEFSDNDGMKKITYAYDPVMGKEKLKQAGYDVSGAVATKDGQPFEVTLLVLNTDFYKRTGQIIQAQLKEVGIKVTIQIMDAVTLTDATSTGNHQMFLYFGNGLDPRYLMFYFFHSSRIKVTNYAWYTTPELNALLEQGQAEPDVTKAQAIYQKVQEMLVKAAPWVPIGDAYVFTGVRKEVRGFQVHPHAFYPLPGYLLHDTWLAKK
jgi:peptide/nickel transport system substrate-binding protein